MVKCNFSVAVPAANLQDYAKEVLEASNNEGIPLRAVPKKDLKGRDEVWRLTCRVGHGKTRRKVAVTGYLSGTVNFQGLNPERIGLDEEIVNAWA